MTGAGERGGRVPSPTSTVAFLGPEGTFTHQAASAWAAGGARLTPVSTVTDVYDAVATGTATHGVVAIENSVEGYVVPSLDAIVAARDVVAVDQSFVRISFDAFEVPGAQGGPVEIVGHPHGLAQCRRYTTEHGLDPVPASSNAAACRDVRPGQVAIGPRICGELYGLATRAQGIEDFHGTRTRFLLLARRDSVADDVRPADPGAPGADTWRTMLAVTPHVTGPGVLARITRAFGSVDVNLSSLITRPLKALENRYVFVVTVDGAPWHAPVRAVLGELLAAGDSLKTLGVFPARGELDEEVAGDRVPPGSVQASATEADISRSLLWGRTT
ncbi:prephenate dehydratase [Sanguibacter suaedae]|uniref:prephenate dehydratase n=1 Tax=Sanguibacter suaedae TaxID=2795737 RepID=A0A934IC83_9MICO|nr:prephenate dehydratase domain-containing protein [Sanguibacter suaedae]MBI9115191.1 prephenate dehydratase [Sanguibacter suaedae]